MEIVLKNGEKLKLELSGITLEYLEEYPGGIEQLKKDKNGEIDSTGSTRRMCAINQMIYALIASNYDKPLTYRQAVRLVDVKDYDSICEWIIAQIPTESNKSHRI